MDCTPKVLAMGEGCPLPAVLLGARGQGGSSPARAAPFLSPFHCRGYVRARVGGAGGALLLSVGICLFSVLLFLPERAPHCSVLRRSARPRSSSPPRLAWGIRMASQRKHSGSDNAGEGKDFHPHRLCSRARPLCCSRKSVQSNSAEKGHPPASMSRSAADRPGCPCAHWTG